MTFPDKQMIEFLTELNATGEWTTEENMASVLTDYTIRTGIDAERERQKSVEGWTEAHDDEHYESELALAAGAYCESAAKPKILARSLGKAFAIPKLWPRGWGNDWWKPKNPRADLVRAGALIIAEIERLDRVTIRAAQEKVE